MAINKIDASPGEEQFASGDKWRYDLPVMIWSRVDDAGFTKCQRALIDHLCRSVGLKGHWKGIDSMAKVTRTHPVYCKLVLAQLIRFGVVLRTLVPGRCHNYRIAPIGVWKKFLDARELERLAVVLEEPRPETSHQMLELDVETEFWTRLSIRLTYRELRFFSKLMREDPEKWVRVMDDTVDRKKRGRLESGVDRLEPLNDKDGCQKHFTDTWKRFK